MDIPTIAHGLMAFLIPFLPYLAKAGEKVAEKAGEAGWNKANEIWCKLLSGGDDLITLGLAQEAATATGEKARQNLELRFIELLSENSEVALEVERLLTEAKKIPTDGVTVNVEKGTGIGINEGDLVINQVLN